MRLTELASRLDGAILSEAVFSGNVEDLASEWNTMQKEVASAFDGVPIGKFVRGSDMVVHPNFSIRLLQRNWGPPNGPYGAAPAGPRSYKEFKSMLDAIDKNGFDKKKIASISRSDELLVLYSLTGQFFGISSLRTGHQDFQKLLDSKTEKGKYIVITNANELDELDRKNRAQNGKFIYHEVYFAVVPNLKTMKQFSSAIRRTIKKPDTGAFYNFGAPSYDDFVKAFKAAESAVNSGYEISGGRIHSTSGDDVERKTGELDDHMSDNNYKGRMLAYYNAGQWLGRYDAPAGAFVLKGTTGYDTDTTPNKSQNEIDYVNRYYKELLQKTKELLAAIEKKRATQKAQKWSVATIEIDGEEAIEVAEDFPSYKEAVSYAQDLGIEDGTAIYVVKGTQRYLKPLGVTEEGDDDATVWLIQSSE